MGRAKTTPSRPRQRKTLPPWRGFAIDMQTGKVTTPHQREVVVDAHQDLLVLEYNAPGAKTQNLVENMNGDPRAEIVVFSRDAATGTVTRTIYKNGVTKLEYRDGDGRVSHVHTPGKRCLHQQLCHLQHCPRTVQHHVAGGGRKK